MVKLIKFERMKIFSCAKIWVVFIAVIAALLAASFLHNYQSAHFSTEQKILQCNKILETIQREIDHLDTASFNDDNIMNLKDDYQRQYDSYVKLKDAYVNGDWKRVLIVLNGLDEDCLDGRYQIRYGSNNSSETNLTALDRQNRIAYRTFLLTENLLPMDDGIVLNGYESILFGLRTIFSMLLPLAALAISADAVSGENSSGTLKLALQQPFSRRKILFSKVFACSMISVIILFVGLLLLFTLSAMKYGLGNAAYPVQANGAFGGAFLLGTEKYLRLNLFILQAVPLSLCAIIFYSSFGALISAYTHSPSASFIGSAIFPILMNILQTRFDFNFVKFTPFYMANSYIVLTGSSSKITALAACIELLVLAVLCILLGTSHFEKRDILC